MNKLNQWGGTSNTPLTKKGVEQAKDVGKRAKDKNLSFDIIVSSPLDRAHNTAKHIAEAIGYPIDKIVLNDLFLERNFGILEGKTVDYALYPVDQSVLDGIDGVEPVSELFERAKKAHNYIQKLPHERILIVAHGAFGRALRDAINCEESYKGGEGFPNAEIFELL